MGLIKPKKAGGSSYPNGTKWTPTTTPLADVSKIRYLKDKWIACFSSYGNKGLYYSLDGITWNPTNLTTGTFKEVVYANELFIAMEYSNGFWYSTDGITWTQSSQTSSSGYATIVYYNGKFMTFSSYKTSLTTTDGITWTDTSRTMPNSNLKLVNGVLFSYGWGSLHYSTDGTTWTKFISESINDVTYADGMYVMVGDSVWKTPDLKTLSQFKTITLGDYQLNTIKYSDGIWVTGADETGLYYSGDVEYWTKVDIGNACLDSITVANGVWVGFHYPNGKICYSTDGKVWNESMTTTDPVRFITYNKDMWHFVLSGGVYYSIAWRP